MTGFIKPYRIEFFPQRLLAVVEREIRDDAPGRVRLEGLSWRARIKDAHGAGIVLPQGILVEVYGRQGLHLLVSPPTVSLI